MSGIIGGLVGGAGSLAGGLLGAGAASKAASQQAAALQQALGWQRQVYGTATANLQPYIGGGQSALAQILGALGLPGGVAGGPTAAYNAFTQTPAYQFPLQQGMLALNRQLASMGLTGSGAALKDAIGYSQGYASQNYQNFLSQLFNVAGAGQTGATALGQIGTNIGQQNLGALAGVGGAQAAGTVGASNALNMGMGGLLASLITNPPGGTSNSPLANAWSWLSNQIGGGTQSSYAPAGGPAP